MHKIKITTIKELKIQPRGRKDIKKVGLFATRTPNRPNALGVSVVELVDRRDNVVTVRGLDAINGTPIFDLKPYTYADIQENIHVPEWIKSLITTF